MSHRARDDEKAETDEASLDGETTAGETTDEEAPRDLVPTTRCPNCGRRFAGTYCPGCGVPTGRPQSILGMASAFLQELINVRRGLWATLRVLTLRPGPALRRYLGAGPRLLMTPGRYLLAAIVVSFGSIRALTWLGVRAPPGEDLSATGDLDETQSGTGAEQMADLTTHLVEVLRGMFASQTYHVASSIVLTGFLALLLWRLFRGSLRRGAQAVALAGFVVGHAVFLEAAVRLVSLPAVYVVSGTATRLSPTVPIGIGVVCAAVAAWATVGSGWTDALKGAGAALFASLEQVLATTLVVGGYSLWLVYTRLGHSGTLSLSVEGSGGTSTFALAALWFGLVTSAPLLLHAAVEAYYCLRE